MVESCDNGFEHCLLKDDKFKVGNRYDTGEFLFVVYCFIVMNSLSLTFFFLFYYIVFTKQELCHCCTQDSEE